MPITVGSLSARLWRVTEALPPQFAEVFERNLKRHAFRPVNQDKGERRSIGWVNIREALDSNLTMNKALFGRVIALGLRIDRISINPRVYRSMLGQEIKKFSKEQKQGRLSDEQQAAIEEKVKLDLIKKQTPAMSVYEMAWRLESGLVIFAGSSNSLNTEFSEWFRQTFELSLEPQFPYIRAERWAKKQHHERDLRELLPSPFHAGSPLEEPAPTD